MAAYRPLNLRRFFPNKNASTLLDQNNSPSDMPDETFSNSEKDTKNIQRALLKVSMKKVVEALPMLMQSFFESLQKINFSQYTKTPDIMTYKDKNSSKNQISAKPEQENRSLSEYEQRLAKYANVFPTAAKELKRRDKITDEIWKAVVELEAAAKSATQAATNVNNITEAQRFRLSVENDGFTETGERSWGKIQYKSDALYLAEYLEKVQPNPELFIDRTKPNEQAKIKQLLKKISDNFKKVDWTWKSPRPNEDWKGHKDSRGTPVMPYVDESRPQTTVSARSASDTIPNNDILSNLNSLDSLTPKPIKSGRSPIQATSVPTGPAMNAAPQIQSPNTKKRTLEENPNAASESANENGHIDKKRKL